MSHGATQSGEALDLSVMIPCRNNVRTIGRVLDSVRGLCSQLVVIDSGSTDGTLELVEACREWCEVVLVQTHWRGFVKTKSMGLNACSKGHALWLDSDEPVSREMAASVRRMVGDGVDAAKVQRVVEYKGKLLMHSWQPEWRLRLVKMDLVRDGRARFAGIDPHDYLEVVDGVAVKSLDGVLVHDSFETFSEHLGNQLRLSRTSAESLHAMGKRGSVWEITTSPIGAFVKQAVVKGSWRDGYAGWLAASTSAAGALMKHVVLYELGRDTQ
jgi:glycosyltransferase involved in cell wall biosynthesis